MALSLDDIFESLKKAGIDSAKAKEVMENLKAVEEEKKEEKELEKGPKQKNQFVAFVMDDGTLAGKELIGYVLQIPEGKDPKSTYDAYVSAVRSYNTTTRKGRKYPVTKVGEGMQIVKGKHLKDGKGGKITIKTKEAIQIFPVKNEIDNPTKVEPQAD